MQMKNVGLWEINTEFVGFIRQELHREVYCVRLNFNLSKLVYYFTRFFYIQQTFLYCNATMRIYKTPLKSPYLSSAVMRPNDSSGAPILSSVTCNDTLEFRVSGSRFL